MNILVIEDSRFLRTLIEKALTKVGYAVTGVADGLEGLRAAHTMLPALILLDMMLPGLDGISVLKALKEDGRTRRIPVVVLTGLSERNEIKLKQAGAAAYVEKSALHLEKNSDELILVVETVLSTSLGRRPAGSGECSQPKAGLESGTKPTESPGACTVIVLLAEDSALYRRMITDHLNEWGFDFVCVNDGKAAWKHLAKPDAPRLALLDWVLPEIEGVELCRRLRSRPEGDQYTYTVLLTAKGRQHEMLEAMDAGADDFLAKPFDPLELKARLLVGKRIVELQQNLVSANATLHFAASHDFLTRIWNRAEIMAFLRRELVRARRGATPLGIILVDVDYFKKVNDELGHQAGDTVLQEIAQRFKSGLREYDGVGRYGGEEFLLVLPGCDPGTTVRRANDIRTLISSKPILSSPRELSVTVSMGVAVADSTATVESVLNSADTALYQAKRNGRNRVESSIATGTILARP